MPAEALGGHKDLSRWELKMSNPTKLALDATILVAYLFANNPSSTGIAIHEWLSIALALVICVHAALSLDWIVATAKRLFAKARAASKLNLVVDSVLFVSFIVVMLSGLLISRVVLGFFGIHAVAGGVWRVLHTLSADVALWTLALHFALHWSWIVDTTNRLFTGKTLAPVTVEGGDHR
jgi:hypothetical protein